VLGALLVARVGVVGAARAGHNADLAALRTVIAPVEPGARVLAVRVLPDDAMKARYFDDQPASRFIMLREDAIRHLPALLVTERRAFWPLLFSGEGKYPVRVLPPYAALADGEGSPPSHLTLSAPATFREEMALGLSPYLPGWREHFDYVLLLYADQIANPAGWLPEPLEQVRIDGVAALYRVKRPAAAAR
jgi:hypothetical protein